MQSLMFEGRHSYVIIMSAGDGKLYAIKKIILDTNEARTRKLRLEAKVMEALTNDVAQVWPQAGCCVAVGVGVGRGLRHREVLLRCGWETPSVSPRICMAEHRLFRTWYPFSWGACLLPAAVVRRSSERCLVMAVEGDEGCWEWSRAQGLMRVSLMAC